MSLIPHNINLPRLYFLNNDRHSDKTRDKSIPIRGFAIDAKNYDYDYVYSITGKRTECVIKREKQSCH